MLNTFQNKKIFLSAIMITFVASVTSVASANGFRAELLKAANSKTSGKYVNTRFLKIMKKPFNQADKKKALIIGDSHAQDFLNTVLENGYLKDYQISTRYISSRCQIVKGQNAKQFIAAKDKAYCNESDNLTKAQEQIAEADLIILAQNWKEWAAKMLPQTIKNLGLKPQQKLIVIGRKSFGKISVRNYLRMPEDKLRALRNKVDAHQVTINDVMKQTLSDAIFVNQQKLVCGTPESCPVFTKDLRLISFDGGHYTKEGALYVGKLLFAGSSLGKL